MTRVALYARYSSDRQNERSVGDQIDLLTRYAEGKGWEVGRTFSDAAISGSTMANRPGLLDAISAAERGEYDVLLAEDEDRIARSLEHLAHVVNRLQDAGAQLATPSSGMVQTMHVAMKGLIAEDFLRNLSAKTKRGMNANAERGLATGSRLFGYVSEPGGGMTIVEAEADIIRRIYAAYAAGDTAREIAAALNAEGVPSPRGGLWNASSVGGSRQRG
ncbi:MAG TPA: recombinase family protein, partial [Phenylobacterium sp.]|nr:recombinase family protein [Phenylobacterium sp.]